MCRVTEMKPTKLTASSIGFIFKLGRESDRHCAAFGQHIKIVLYMYGVV